MRCIRKCDPSRRVIRDNIVHDGYII
jgi:hypothetical protein